jgi:hypothetical protein
MKIRFLKNCKARQQHLEYCGDGCCSWPVWEMTDFDVGEEADPEEFWKNIDLSSLEYKVDFEILEYP